MHLTQLVLAEAARRPDRRPGTPAVVNVASSAALGPTPYACPEYAAAKAGLVRLTEAERAGLPRLIPPTEVTRTVLDLLARGEPGTVVELLGEQ